MMRDAELIEAMDNISRVGGVAVVHAENGDIVAEVTNIIFICSEKKSLKKICFLAIIVITKRSLWFSLLFFVQILRPSER